MYMYVYISLLLTFKFLILKYYKHAEKNGEYNKILVGLRNVSILPYSLDPFFSLRNKMM